MNVSNRNWLINQNDWIWHVYDSTLLKNVAPASERQLKKPKDAELCVESEIKFKFNRTSYLRFDVKLIQSVL